MALGGKERRLDLQFASNSRFTASLPARKTCPELCSDIEFANNENVLRRVLGEMIQSALAGTIPCMLACD